MSQQLVGFFKLAMNLNETKPTNKQKQHLILLHGVSYTWLQSVMPVLHFK